MRLASSDYRETSSRFLRIREFLSKIHTTLFRNRKTAKRTIEERSNLRMDPRSFDDLKKHFTEEPVLAMPDHTKPFQIECDASKYATGVVLIQLDSNGDRHPCAFISKTFSPTEWNYEIYDRELMAII